MNSRTVDDDVEVASFDIDPNVQALFAAEFATASDADVLVVLPREVDDGIGIYDETQVTTAKELSAAGVPTRFLNRAQDERLFASEYSADFVAPFAIGILSTLTYDQAKVIARYIYATVTGRYGMNRKQRVCVKIARMKSAHAEVEGLRVTGPTSEAAERVISILVDGRGGASDNG